jgi:hypothetical protein
VSVGTVGRETPAATAPAPGARLRSLAGSPGAVTVAALTLLAAVLRLYRLGHQGFWFDEGNTALLVHLGPGKMVGLIPQSESSPPLYYCLAWLWVRVFGYGEAGLRSLSALAGVLTIPVAYSAARKLLGTRAGLIAAALAATNPLLIWYSQEARSYSLLVLLTSVSLLAFAHARAEPEPRAVAAWVLASVLALATHYYAVLAILPQAALLLVRHRRQRPVQIGIAVVGGCGLALIPLALSQNGTGNARWISHIPLGPRLGQIVPMFLTGTGAPAQRALERIDEVVAVLALLLLAVRADVRERRAALTAGGMALTGFVLMLLLVAGGVDDLITRNLIALWLPATIAVTGGLAARRAGLAGLACAAVLCVTGLVAATGIAFERNLQRPDWRAVARVLGPAPVPGSGERVILLQHYEDVLPLSLYMHGLRFWRHGGPVVASEIDVVAISAPRTPLCWWGAACNLQPTRLQPVYAIPGFHELWRRHALQFSIVRLVSGAPVRVSRGAIAGALTATTLRRDVLITQR